MRAIRKYFQKYWKYKIQQTKEELNTMKIGNDIYYVGVNDHQVDLFEGQYVVPNGMSYNSYVIKDEKIAVMDTVDAGFTEEWLGKVAEVLDGAKPDKRLTFIPWHVVRFGCNVVTFCGRYRNNSYIGKFQFFYQCCDLILNVAETFFIIFNKIHFVYCKYKVTDSHQCADSCMTSCLYQYSL